MAVSLIGVNDRLVVLNRYRRWKPKNTPSNNIFVCAHRGVLGGSPLLKTIREAFDECLRVGIAEICNTTKRGIVG